MESSAAMDTAALRLSAETPPASRPTPGPVPKPGPLSGVKVVELAHEFCAFAGSLLAQAGAEVIVVEPPGGAPQRAHGPFADGQPGPERSLSWWAENGLKRSVVIDLNEQADIEVLRSLIVAADVFLEAEAAGTLADLGLDYEDLAYDNADLIHASVSPTGRAGPAMAATDLTILARGGPMWSCGYDDHALPPVRGRGNQGIRIAAHFTVMSVMTALLARERHGGQFIDVSMVAAANVTTEFASYGWLSAQETVQRQTGRHATKTPSEPTQVQCADGRFLNTGVPPRRPAEFSALHDWITELGLAEEFALTSVLELGSQYGLITLQMVVEDPLAGEVFQAGREAMHFIASRLSAHEAFVGFQKRGIACGVVWSPDEALQDPHFVERGFPTEVFHDEIGRGAIHAGAPIRFTASPMTVGQAPTLGSHDEQYRAEVTDENRETWSDDEAWDEDSEPEDDSEE